MQEPNSEQPLPPFPAMAKAAGILWIIEGVLLFLNVPVRLVLAVAIIANKSSDVANAIATSCSGAVMSMIFGVAFFRSGAETLRGTYPSIGGTGSLVIGLVGVVATTTFAISSRIPELLLLFYYVISLNLLSAGTFAILSRKDYQALYTANAMRPIELVSIADRAPMTEGPDLLLEAERLQSEGRWSEAIDRFEEICKTPGYETYRDYAKMCLASLRKKVADEGKA